MIRNSYKTPEPPAGLTERILSKIAERERRLLRAKIAASASVFIFSVLAIVTATKDLMGALARSGFFDFSSLIFSDFSSIAKNFPDFVYSMLESLPIFTTALLLGGLMFAIWSMAAFIDETSLLRTK